MQLKKGTIKKKKKEQTGKKTFKDEDEIVHLDLNQAKM